MNTDTSFDVEMTVVLQPRWHQDPPLIRLGVNNDLCEVALEQSTVFDIKFTTPPGSCQFSIELLNKKDSDTVPEKNLDKAVIVERIGFFGINDPRFVWAGEYRPQYPEPWASQQTDLEPVLKSHTYLGWNGKWTLTFDVPVFTWMHKIQNLGWIYS